MRHSHYSRPMVALIGRALPRLSWAALGMALRLAVLLGVKFRFEERWQREKFQDCADHAGRMRRLVP